jgi:hypothetical protein
VTLPVSAAAPSGAGAILSISPAYPDPSVAVGKSYFVHSVEAGATWTDGVEVTNTNSVTVDAWVDAVDGITSAQTGAVYSARTVAARSTGAWVKLSVSSITVPPHTHAVISFTVTVPSGASAGDHVAGIAVESRQGTILGGSVAITTVLRSVVAVQVTVPGAAPFTLAVYGANVEALAATGTAGIALDMANAGGRLDKAQLEITLEGPAGYHRLQSLGLDTMLPGDRIVDGILWLDALAPGDYRLSVVEDGAGRHGTAFVTTFHLASALIASTPGQVEPAVPTAPGPSVPMWVIIGSPAVAAGLLMLAVVMVVRRRRRLR